MGYTGADLLVDSLESYGVTHLFGNPGTTELPLMQSVVDSELEYVLGLHEDVAVGAAAGYAMRRRHHANAATDETRTAAQTDVLPLGVANLHLAGGLAHGLGNLYNANISGAPVLLTAGTHSRDFQQEEPILSGDLVSMAEPFTKWSAEVKDVAALPRMVRRAVRTALTPPTGPVFLSLPVDVQQAKTEQSPERLGKIPTAGRGDADAIGEAATALTNAEDPVIVLGDEVGRRGSDAVAAAVELAEAAGARVHNEILAYEVNFPTAHEQWQGVLSTKAPATAAAMDTDTLVFVGCSTNTTVTRPTRRLVPEDANCVHIAADAWELGKHAPADTAVLGDPAAILPELADRVAAAVDEGERERRLEGVRAWAESEASGSTTPETVDGTLTKAGLARAFRRVAPDALVVSEAITASPPLLDEFPFEATQLLGTKGGGLGYGLPASVGAAVAEREAGGDRSVLGYVGDGSYLYYPQTLYTATRYDLDLTVVIPDNRNYRILKENTAALMGGDPDEFDYAGIEFEPPVDLVGSAEAHGATGITLESPAEIDETIGEALEHDGPVVVDVPVVDR
ncbi:thiamine pyrophosphate-binding protein [Natrialba taiwanensis]|uniref:Thiamine pyrophosphate domain-containing TPP-binding protein n=1 Tax=Natrialba taiwanensis DSM 12281 TaxID=1230458 RepID=M0ABR3_9EURY|nr:thiamine pyrophosphate-dependent enzyme [Natrialba taiwanensis]ELY95831.1 thiamine pyrophosphate domain-containing TPP-binding protein [Natrialba taiwanensis DSM 12281]